MFKSGEKTVAGIHPLPNDVQHPPYWLTYVVVEDVVRASGLSPGARSYVAAASSETAPCRLITTRVTSSDWGTPAAWRLTA